MRSQTIRSRRGSWLFLALSLVLLVTCGVAAVTNLRSRGHELARQSAVEDAHVISNLTAMRNLTAANAGDPLAAQNLTDLDGDVAQLQAHGNLFGIVIHRADGAVLYRRGIAPTATAALPGAAPSSTVFATLRQGERRTHIADVTLATGIGQGPRAIQVSLVLPGSDASDELDISLLTGAVVLILLLLGGALVFTRFRLTRRAHEATHDGLTGLGNRSLLEQEAARLFRGECEFALLMMDLDGFKRVNDALGHAAGDELLVKVADSIRRCTRPEDIMVRLGGDEFAVLAPGLHEGSAEPAAERLLSCVRQQFTVRGVGVDCDASIGVAIAHEDGRDVGELMQAADIAMYQAKRGRLGVCAFADTDEEVDAGTLQLLNELRRGIAAGELRLHYQPAVAIQRPSGHYVEALVRWEHPVRGLLAPGSFVPLAEETALIHPLTSWVIEVAIAQCAQWRLDGLETTVAVNVSPRSLVYPGLVDTIVDALARNQLPAEALHIEVTESAVIARPETARDILSQLRDRGVSISIDDFGTGYTSLAHLKTLPVETLKIDRRFVATMLADRSDETVVSSVIQLAHGLGMHVVAEGVEDAPTLDRLGEMGCDIAQGYFLSRPLDADAATRWLRSQDASVVTSSDARR